MLRWTRRPFPVLAGAAAVRTATGLSPAALPVSGVPADPDRARWHPAAAPTVPPRAFAPVDFLVRDGAVLRARRYGAGGSPIVLLLHGVLGDSGQPEVVALHPNGSARLLDGIDHGALASSPAAAAEAEAWLEAWPA